MGKLFSIVLASLVWVPAAAVFKPNEEPPTRRPMPDYVSKTVLVEIQGKLQVVPVPYFNPHKPIPPLVSVTVSGQAYSLDFSQYEDLREAALKLDGKTVMLKGALQEKSVTVTRLEAAADADEFIRQTVHLEIRGTLDQRTSRERLLLKRADDFICSLCVRPFERDWIITANGQQYVLDFDGNEELLKQAKELRGQKVILNGTVELRFECDPSTLKWDNDKLWHCPAPKEVQVIRVTGVELAFDGK